MSKFTPTDTFHLEFDTQTYPGRIECVEITIRRNISSDPKKTYNIALCAHPLYAKLERYVLGNPSKKDTAK